MNARRATLSWLAIIVIGALTTACSQTDDAGLTMKIKAKMAADNVVNAYEIEVRTVDGVVTLTGNIDSVEAKERALVIARETSGVILVQDMLAARQDSGGGDAPEPPRTVGGVLDDASITLRVKGRLLDDPLVKGLAIDVDTRKGVVYLTGTVGTAEEKEQAIRLARETQGVHQVEANLELQRS